MCWDGMPRHVLGWHAKACAGMACQGQACAGKACQGQDKAKASTCIVSEMRRLHLPQECPSRWCQTHTEPHFGSLARQHRHSGKRVYG
ncbi:hypothetical protein HanPI659440_Chr00c40g0740541 [Helianthus annuus]|nr:hypothetical protein HanHA300_Chr00c0792g0813271 [Helianthus annuus]KAJ0625202.1 hypothetical protein HanHA300_Chr00c0757g0809871 [Helianthus annuus]KAJ0629570.1 hypothetical protein HanHA89_Chr00c15g0748141 [Helianthus annuus]KAJ0629575.1 hypothetical protein HanHA89_Chr00c15g0748511 [Helianthus annuus]KAJ0629577.1 hypothetical protein HanHA89_Chr00c15g0748611 [Helianthus annuus]